MEHFALGEVEEYVEKHEHYHSTSQVSEWPEVDHPGDFRQSESDDETVNGDRLLIGTHQTEVLVCHDAGRGPVEKKNIVAMALIATIALAERSRGTRDNRYRPRRRT